MSVFEGRPLVRVTARVAFTIASFVVVNAPLVGCGTERRATGPGLPDGDVLQFDAAMIRSDAGLAPRDLGSPRDAATMRDARADAGPLVVRDSCIIDADCDDGIDCTSDACTSEGTCSRTRVDAECAPGLACLALTRGTGCVPGARCDASPCDAVAGCGCASGQACVYVEGELECRLSGGVVEGGACGSTLRCAPGLACLAAGTSVGVCSPYCRTGDDSACAGAGSRCEIGVPGHESERDYPDRICSRSCNPVDGTGCGSGTTCLIFGVTGVSGRYFTDCRLAGSGVQWTRCVGPNSCQPGYSCVDTREGAGFRCLHACRWDVFRADCPSGLACVYGGSPPTVIDGQEYGYCGVY